VFLVTLHAGSGLLNPTLTTGKLLFAIFLILAGSGVVWRLKYMTVPKEAAPMVLNYSSEGALRRAGGQLLEIEKITAGQSPELHRATEHLLARDVMPHELPAIVQSVPPAERGLVEEIVRLAQSRRRALARPPLQQAFTSRMQRWRAVHVPLAFVFVLGIFA